MVFDSTLVLPSKVLVDELLSPVSDRFEIGYQWYIHNHISIEDESSW